MNNFKNFVIFVFSLIILIQSIFLIYFIHRQSAVKKTIPQHRSSISVNPILKIFSVPAVKEIKIVKPLEVKPILPKIEPAIKQESVSKVVEPTAVVVPRPKAMLGKIVLVIDDWGYNLRNKDFVTGNDYHFTLSILPFRAYSVQVAQLAYGKNKDVIVHMPMEPKDKENYTLEENTLMTGMDKNTIVKLLDSAFEVVPHAKGLSNHMGSKATADLNLMKIVLGYTKRKHMIFLDSFVTADTVCRKLANSMKINFASRDIFIDNENSPDYIKKQLIKTATRARQAGFAIAIGHDRPSTITVLKEMIPKLEEEGYKFVNLSEIIE